MVPRIVIVYSLTMLSISAFSLIALLIAGLIHGLVDSPHTYGFFSYRIYLLDGLPAWFVAYIALIIFNGKWLAKLASFDLQLSSSDFSNGWSAGLPVNPLKLLAINFATIPGIIIVFQLIRLWGL